MTNSRTPVPTTLLIDPVQGAKGQFYPQFNLDGTNHGSHGVQLDCGQDDEPVWRPLSAEYAIEDQIDEYIKEFTNLIYPLTQVVGPKEAISMVHSARNGRRDRSRMEALKEVAATTEAIKQAKQILQPHKIEIATDHYEIGTLWLNYENLNEPEGGVDDYDGKGVFKPIPYRHWSNVCINISEPGKVTIGFGDGYHRVPITDPLPMTRLGDKDVIERIKKGWTEEDMDAKEVTI